MMNENINYLLTQGLNYNQRIQRLVDLIDQFPAYEEAAMAHLQGIHNHVQALEVRVEQVEEDRAEEQLEIERTLEWRGDIVKENNKLKERIQELEKLYELAKDYEMDADIREYTLLEALLHIAQLDPEPPCPCGVCPYCVANKALAKLKDIYCCNPCKSSHGHNQ